MYSKSASQEMADSICENINHEKAWKKYFPLELILSSGGKICLSTKYTNPFREKKDNKPGCNFAIGYKRKGYVFTDYARYKFYDIFQVVSEVLFLNFDEAVELLSCDEELYDKTSLIKKAEKTEFEEMTYTLFQEYPVNDYFFKGGITEKTLRHFNVSCAKYVKFKNEVQAWHPRNPLYIYLFEGVLCQTYRPLTEAKNKFRTNVREGKILNLNRISESSKDVLILTKSYKDIMTLHECGYPAIMTVGEGILPDEGLMNWLNLEYDKMFILYDNDTAGIRNTEKITKEFDFLTPLFMPEDAKDSFEFSTKHGIYILKQYLDGKIKS